ncbi:hypothetical protein IQ252_16155 [Tychonema sp. LEGE 07203]|nr:hypothetical protein [Tychonema sp. LEGE 07203]
MLDSRFYTTGVEKDKLIFDFSIYSTGVEKKHLYPRQHQSSRGSHR